MTNQSGNNILVHVCCAPCAIYPFELLTKENHSITGYFFNPNIYPNEEYQRRKRELIELFSKKNYNYIIEEINQEKWYKAINGLEQENEKGLRCDKCFEMRLEQTASYAANNGFDAFTTVLTISPHKNSKVINKIGKELAEKYNIKFLEENFKKQEGFKKSLEYSRINGLYRQNYCGCEFSLR